LLRFAARLPYQFTSSREITAMSPLFAMFGLGGWEILVVGLVILLLFGNRLPSLMRSLGRSVVEFKHGVNEIEEDEGSKAGSKP
jgi:sec-independent protein translocase protein TatA